MKSIAKSAVAAHAVLLDARLGGLDHAKAGAVAALVKRSRLS